MDRQILHCDMNNFFASVECLYNPQLRSVPLAVCGSAEKRHGIVLAKNELAKAQGVVTAEAIWQAKNKCPDLVCVEPHFDRYMKFSRIAKEIYAEYTDLVEPFGMDECWLDVSASRRLFGQGKEIAETIRTRIKNELGLTISVGVSFNKIFAKLGSDLKKPDATSVIPRDSFREIVWPLPVEALLGVGKKMSEHLRFFGIDTVGKLAQCDRRFLQIKFGKCGLALSEYANGDDSSPVLPMDFELPMKSVGHGTTTAKDMKNQEEVWRVILGLSQEIGEKLRFHKKKATGIAVVLKDNTLFSKEFQKKLSLPSDCTMTLAREAFRLFAEQYRFQKPLRSVTVRAIGLISEKNGTQLSLFTDKISLRDERIDAVTDSIRNRYGSAALLNAVLLRSEENGTDSFIREQNTEFLEY